MGVPRLKIRWELTLDKECIESIDIRAEIFYNIV